MIRSQNIIPTFTWANKPSSYITGQPVFISNAGPKGSHWWYDGTRWKPVNGMLGLASLDSASSSIGNTYTIVLQYQIPAGMWQTGDVIRVQGYFEKSGTTDTGAMIMYCGTAGTTSDTTLSSVTTMSAANRSALYFTDFRLEAATSAQQTSINLGYGANTPVPAAVTISSASANALYISLGIRSSGTTDTVIARAGAIQLFSKAN